MRIRKSLYLDVFVLNIHTYMHRVCVPHTVSKQHHVLSYVCCVYCVCFKSKVEDVSQHNNNKQQQQQQR